jgi:hypothetical protein
MQLPFRVLGQRLEGMPLNNEHTMVWHLCNEVQHSAPKEGCYGIGKLAVVSFDVPEIENIYEAGIFLMRLHPLAGSVKELENGEHGVWMPGATSHPYSTVWHYPVKSEGFQYGGKGRQL